MRQLKGRSCDVCGKAYLPTGSCSKFCDDCKEEAKKAYQRKAQMEYRIRLGKPVGIGKGGSNKKGKDHPQYINGIGFFNAMAKEFRKERRYCEICGKDLLNVGVYFRCIHHKDHNHFHNVIENYELVCKSCHQKEHDAAAHLNN